MPGAKIIYQATTPYTAAKGKGDDTDGAPANGLIFNSKNDSIVYNAPMPDKNKGVLFLIAQIVHVLVWVIGLALGATSSFMAHPMLNATTEVGSGVANAVSSSQELDILAGIGGTMLILGVVGIVLAAIFVDEKFHQNNAWPMLLIFTCTNFGFATLLCLLEVAGQDTNHWYFWITLFAVAFVGLGTCMLYATSDALGVVLVQRVFLLTMLNAFCIVTSILVHSGDFHTSTWTPSWEVKNLTIVQAILWLTVTVFVVVLRMIFREETTEKMAVSSFTQYPLIRGVAIFLAFAGFALALYIASALDSYSLAMGRIFSRVVVFFNLIVCVRVLDGTAKNTLQAKTAMA